MPVESMSGYTKLFGSIVASTVWREDDKTRLVWITMLAMADRHGVVEASVPGLADMARVSVEDCRAAIRKLESPDPDSRSKEQDGRRIVPVDGGWRLVNHEKYRQTLMSEERKAYWALKKRKQRAATECPTLSPDVQLVPKCPTCSGDGAEGAKLLAAGAVEEPAGKEQQEDAPKKRRADLMTKARIVLAHLNDKAGRRFPETDKNLSLAAARLQETDEDTDGIRKMIDRQIERWRGTDQEEYLRPSTLFRQSKFAEYYANKDLPPFHDHNQQPGRSGHQSNRDRTTHTEAPGERFISGRPELRKQHAAAAAADDAAMDGPVPL